MNRKAEYLIRTAAPPGVLSTARAWAQARRYQSWPSPLKVVLASRWARLDLVPLSLDLYGGLVVDIGANVGAWSEAVLRVAPRAEVVAVEPSPVPYRALVERLSRFSQARTHQRAVGRAPGKAKFFVTEHSHNSSLLQPHPGMDDVYGWGWKVADAVEVDVVTLDSLVAGADVGLLKIDVQGGELDVLRGGKETLRRTAAILVEVTMVSHYGGDATFPSLHEHLVAEGFELSALSEPFLSARQRILWMDACYLRSDIPDFHGLLSRYGPGTR